MDGRLYDSRERGRWIVALGLGSNLGDRLALLRRAAAELGRGGDTVVVARSRVCQSPPAGGPPQPDYLDAVVLVRTGLDPRSLLARAQRIERALGRCRPEPVRWGPRPIDIDLLWSPGLAVDEPGLTLPHPLLAERPFVLRPLLALVPGARDPRSGATYAGLAAARAHLAWLGPL
ncbi:MAG: 2-amino-4-hydroxy-6-hydroxymethyldihydropteridine diphosphokinase [Deltaproteobacteria bacterium]|nr:2-amino-4-hydroxy-6-hydroxymethyldihydropteridine diphosphokinase [Deltaproteobacteria bacterium]